jgi:hypothetical protein
MGKHWYYYVIWWIVMRVTMIKIIEVVEGGSMKGPMEIK